MRKFLFTVTLEPSLVKAAARFCQARFLFGTAGFQSMCIWRVILILRLGGFPLAAAVRFRRPHR